MGSPLSTTEAIDMQIIWHIPPKSVSIWTNQKYVGEMKYFLADGTGGEKGDWMVSVSGRPYDASKAEETWQWR